MASALALTGLALADLGAVQPLAGGRATGAGPLPMIDLNPISWLGDAASAAVADVWKAAMIGLWSAGLWLLQLAFRIIDAFTTPDLSAHGPLGPVLPTTLWIGAFVAATMMFVQLTVALLRRDGRSLGRVLYGVVQFGLVWVGYLGVAGGLVTAAAGLTRSILQATLNVDTLSAFDPASSWPREVLDTTVATVLGVGSLLLLIPAAFFYLLIMLVREAALIILVATAPISAGGLVAESTRTWFWKSLRWFVSCLLISPTAALVLGIGVRLSAGVVAGDGDRTAAAAGMAIVGAVLIAIGAVCPLVLFRLLAFVEPGTASGAALRQSWADAGGLAGVIGGGGAGGRRQSAGSSAAVESGGDGRSAGESGAESATGSRLAMALGPALGAVGTGVRVAASVAHRATDLGSDILGQAGVGSAGYSMTPADERSARRTRGGTGRSAGGRGSDADDSGNAVPPPTPPGPPTPETPPPAPPAPSPPVGPGGGGTGPRGGAPAAPGGPGGSGGRAGGAAETAAGTAL